MWNFFTFYTNYLAKFLRIFILYLWKDFYGRLEGWNNIFFKDIFKTLLFYLIVKFLLCQLILDSFII